MLGSKLLGVYYLLDDDILSHFHIELAFTTSIEKRWEGKKCLGS